MVVGVGSRPLSGRGSGGGYDGTADLVLSQLAAALTRRLSLAGRVRWFARDTIFGRRGTVLCSAANASEDRPLPIGRSGAAASSKVFVLAAT